MTFSYNLPSSKNLIYGYLLVATSCHSKTKLNVAIFFLCESSSSPKDMFVDETKFLNYAVAVCFDMNLEYVCIRFRSVGPSNAKDVTKKRTDDG